MLPIDSIINSIVDVFIYSYWVLSLRISQNFHFYCVWESQKHPLLLSLKISKILILFKEMNITFSGAFVQVFGSTWIQFVCFGLQLRYQHQWFNTLATRLGIQYSFFNNFNIYFFSIFCLEKLCLGAILLVFVTCWT